MCASSSSGRAPRFWSLWRKENRRYDDICFVGRNARAELAHEKWLSSLPASEDCVYDFPEGYYEAIIREGKKRQSRQTALRRAAVIFVTILLGGAVLYAVNPDVRAFVHSWFRETYRSTSIYHFTEDSELTELPNYELGYIPDGFEELNRFQKRDKKSLLYVNPDTEDCFAFECYLLHEAMHIQVSYEDNLYYESVQVNGLPADYYAADESSETNTLIWFDKTEQIVFIIDSNIDKETMLKIAEGIVIKNSPKS